MAKNFLAFLGLLFLTLMVILGVLLLGVFYDRIGMISLPQGVVPEATRLEGLLQTPLRLLTPGPVTVEVSGSGKAEWSNPLDQRLPIATVTEAAAAQGVDAVSLLPDPTETPVPTRAPRPTITPVPPLDPAEYQSQAMARLKDYAAALQKWMDANNQFTQDGTRLTDPTWRSQMQIILDRIAATGQALAAVGPAPQQYAAIDTWLKRAGRESAALRQNYRQALTTGDSKSFMAAGQNFTRIKEDLTQAVNAMAAAGWNLQQ